MYNVYTLDIHMCIYTHIVNATKPSTMSYMYSSTAQETLKRQQYGPEHGGLGFRA